MQVASGGDRRSPDPAQPGLTTCTVPAASRPSSKLVDGRAFPSCTWFARPFNVTDFDGDQMAVHVPLAIELQTEARM